MPMTCCVGRVSSEWFNGKRIDNPNTHGTGCTLSSAIASIWQKAMIWIRQWNDASISGALAAMLDLGKGSGPMNHGCMTGKYTEMAEKEDC